MPQVIHENLCLFTAIVNISLLKLDFYIDELELGRVMVLT
jgi:hypothetical protein